MFEEVLLSFVEREAAGPVEHTDAKHFTPLEYIVLNNTSKCILYMGSLQ